MANISGLDPAFKPWAIYLFDYAKWLQLGPRFTSGYRSFQEQERLYRRWLDGRHPLPVAPPGRSLHNYGLAVDLVSQDNARLGALWISWGGRWGGSGDPVHFSV